MGKLWKLKKSLCPYNKEPQKGNLITSEANLKTHSINYYKSVLSNRPMSDNINKLKEYKEDLFKRRLQLAKRN